jgi:hypothetical protein
MFFITGSGHSITILQGHCISLGITMNIPFNGYNQPCQTGCDNGQIGIAAGGASGCGAPKAAEEEAGGMRG